MEQVDFLIIGAGIAGAAVAYRLAPHGSLAVLEMESLPGYHATGRSTATFVESYGGDVARALTTASRSFLMEPPAGFSDVSLLRPRGNLRIGSEAERGLLEAEYAHCSALVPGLRMIDGAEARDMCPVLSPAHAACGLFEPDASDMDVHAIHQGYLKGARSYGAALHTDVPVRRIERLPLGWRVHSDNHTFRARMLVNAAGAWADHIAALADVAKIGLQPRRRTVVTFDPPDSIDARLWPLVRDAHESFYFKPIGSGLLVTPADAKPSEPVDARPEEMEIAVAMERLSRATGLKTRHLTSRWAGLRSFVHDEMPVVGPATDDPAFFWVAALGGVGIQTSAAVGMAAAAMIRETAWPSELAEVGVGPETLMAARLATVSR